jgi:hypothetical protein
MDSRMDGDWRSKEIIYERKREEMCKIFQGMHKIECCKISQNTK